MKSRVKNFLWGNFSKDSSDHDYFSLLDSEKEFRYFIHNHNCGFPGKRRTERTIELGIADYWLDHVFDPWEVGAVTPYYWPGRVENIVDPADSHRRINHRLSLFEIDFTGRNVLSISTIEHVGEGSYGLSEETNPIEALEKLATESQLMLLTFPIGWNRELDHYVLQEKTQLPLKVRFLVRDSNEIWKPSYPDNAYRPYGTSKSKWANSVAILEKGETL